MKFLKLRQVKNFIISFFFLKILEEAHVLEDSLDYFSHLLHSLMIETGFRVVNNGHEWKKSDSNSYNFVYNFEQSDATCSINIHKIGPVTVIVGLCFQYILLTLI